MGLTCLSVTGSHPPVISEGAPEPTRSSHHVQKTEVSTGSTQWAASRHKPSGSLADFLTSNCIHNFWWQLHDFHFHSRVTKWANCCGTLWFGYKDRHCAAQEECRLSFHHASTGCIQLQEFVFAFIAFWQEFWLTARGDLLPLSQNGTPIWVLFTVLVRGDHQPDI